MKQVHRSINARFGRAMGLTDLSKIFDTGRNSCKRAASDKYDQTIRVRYEVLTVTTDDLVNTSRG
jgi:hypothetical protein